MKALRPGGRLVVCRSTSGTDGGADLSLPRLFFKQIEIIGSTMGSYREFADVTRLVAQGLPVTVDESIRPRRLPRCARAAPAKAPAQLSRLVLRHPGTSASPAVRIERPAPAAVAPLSVTGWTAPPSLSDAKARLPTR